MNASAFHIKVGIFKTAVLRQAMINVRLSYDTLLSYALKRMFAWVCCGANVDAFFPLTVY
ncbi:MAG: hypothetical protein ACI936_002595 [Paraglaciecola sp.]|jgi:hypothetical protein